MHHIISFIRIHNALFLASHLLLTSHTESCNASERTKINVLFVEDSSVARKLYIKSRDEINKDENNTYFINESPEFVCEFGYLAVEQYKRCLASNITIDLIILDINMCSLFLDDTPTHEKAGIQLAMFLRGRESLYNHDIVRSEGKECFFDKTVLNPATQPFMGTIITSSDEKSDFLEEINEEYMLFTHIAPKIKNRDQLSGLICNYLSQSFHGLPAPSEEPPDRLDAVIQALEKMPAFLPVDPLTLQGVGITLEGENLGDSEFLTAQEQASFETEITNLIGNRFPGYCLTSESLDDIVWLTRYFYKDIPIFTVEDMIEKRKRINFIWNPPDRAWPTH